MRGTAYTLILLSLAATCAAQRGFNPGTETATWARLEGGGYVNENTVRTARETASHSITLPHWTNPVEFPADVFTFTRIIFWSDPNKVVEPGIGGGGRGGGIGRGWTIDYPDADLNLSHRLQQLTSMKVDPDARVMKLTNPELARFPLIYMEHIERMTLRRDEVDVLRRYLLSGGTLLVNDFWGEMAWRNLESEIRRVLPCLNWTELTLDHPIFRSVFPIKGPMSSLRVPSMQRWNWNYDPSDPFSNPTDRFRGEGYETMHIRALHDERGRILVLAIHNSDVSDGWEREGEYEEYFKVFSEARAYPLGINLIFYLMTH